MGLGARDADDNLCVGEVVALETHGSYLRGEGGVVAALGVEDLVVLVPLAVVLVTWRDSDQKVSQLVATLKKDDGAAATQTRRVYRPWGFY